MSEDAAREVCERIRRNVKPPPPLVVAVLRTGARQNLALTGGRTKYDRLARNLSTLDWIRVECLDANGALLETFVQDEEYTPEPEQKLLDLDPETRRVEVIMCAVDRLADRQSRMLGSAIEGIGAVVGAMQSTLTMMVQRMAQLEQGYSDAMRALHEAAEHVQGGNGEGDNSLMGGLLGQVVAGSLPPGLRSAIAQQAAGMVQGATEEKTP